MPPDQHNSSHGLDVSSDVLEVMFDVEMHLAYHSMYNTFFMDLPV